MDTIFTRLEEASRMGDVESLKRLLEEDKLLLDRVMVRTSVGDSSLHVASLLGHADFVREIISRKPELAKDLNGEGLSPLHLAAAHGHLPVVKELLKAGVDLCFVREEKEGLMPLHLAVMKGKTLIVKELIDACEQVILEITDRGETTLHLAVKSNSLDTLDFLISRIQDLNVSDEKGNTILHLAVARKQLSVIKLLLRNPGVDVNSVNSKGFTPLDLLLESRPEYGDLVIGEMIQAAGGKTTPHHGTSEHALTDNILNHVSDQGKSSKPLTHPLGSKEHIESANTEPQKETNRQNSDILVIVAVLIATITFQGVVNPPEGFIQDEGEAVNGFKLLFFLCDTFGLFLSVSVILLFLCVVPRKRRIVMKFLVWIVWLATFSTALAFTIIVREIFSDTVWTRSLIVGWLAVLMGGILWVGIRLIIFLLKKGKHLDSIKWFFYFLVKQPFRWQRLNGTAKIVNWLKNSTSLRKTVSIVSILFVLIIITCICVIIIYVMILLL